MLSLWAKILPEYKLAASFKEFKVKITKLKCDTYPCRLYKKFQPNLQFMNFRNMVLKNVDLLCFTTKFFKNLEISPPTFLRLFHPGDLVFSQFLTLLGNFGIPLIDWPLKSYHSSPGDLANFVGSAINFPLPLFTKSFPAPFVVINLWVSRSLRHWRFLGKLFLKVSSKIFRDSMGNGYCKKDYSKGEVNVVEITKIRLRKMKRNAAMTCSYCLVSKVWKKDNILCCLKKGRKP